MIPEIEPNLVDLKDAELYEYVKKQFANEDSGKGLTDKISKKMSEINSAYFDNTIKTMDEEDFNYIVNPYPISNIFKILNKEEYCLIRDGFITIGGEASAGKTSFLTDISIDLLRNNKDTAFLFYSLDDGSHISGKRILSQINQKNLFHTSIEDKSHKSPHLNLLNKIVIRESININLLIKEADAVKKKTGCSKLIIGIDYLQAIPSEDSGDRRIFLNNYFMALKEKQKSLEKAGGCIMFCLSQMNRDENSGGYRYRDTSEIENKSDVCMDIELPKIEKKVNGIRKTIGDKESNERVIRVMKNKMGKRGMTFKGEISTAFNYSKLEYEIVKTDPEELQSISSKANGHNSLKDLR